MKVVKLGGKALRDAPSLERAGDLIDEEGAAIVVNSAAAGVTDSLQELFEPTTGPTRQDEILDRLSARHRALLDDLSLHDDRLRREIDRSLERVARYVETHGPRSEEHVTARVIGLGERLMGWILEASLKASGQNARYVSPAEAGLEAHGSVFYANLRLDDGQARTEHLRRFSEQGTVVIVPGFQAPGPRGRTHLLGRGGSDVTAAVLAANVRADRLDLYKDVPGMHTADPGLVDEARPIPEMSYRQADTAALRGANILHPATIPPLEVHDIPARIYDVQGPESPSTRICACPAREHVAPMVVVQDSPRRGSVPDPAAGIVDGRWPPPEEIAAVSVVHPSADPDRDVGTGGLVALGEAKVPIRFAFTRDGGRTITFVVPSKNVQDAVETLHEHQVANAANRECVGHPARRPT